MTKSELGTLQAILQYLDAAKDNLECGRIQHGADFTSSARLSVKVLVSTAEKKLKKTQAKSAD